MITILQRRKKGWWRGHFQYLFEATWKGFYTLIQVNGEEKVSEVTVNLAQNKYVLRKWEHREY